MVQVEKDLLFFVHTRLEAGHTGQSFFSATSVNEHVYFTSSYGRVWKYSLKDASFELKELSVKDDIIAIHQLPGNKLIMATRTSGFIVGNAALDSLTYYNPVDKFDFMQYPIRSMYVDSCHEVWFEVKKIGGVCHFNPFTQTFKVEQIAVEQEPGNAPRFAICEDGQGNLWVHPEGGGLSWFDRKNNRLQPFYNEAGTDSWRFSNKLHAMMLDHQGNLWLGTHSKGLDKVTFFKINFVCLSLSIVIMIPMPIRYEPCARIPGSSFGLVHATAKSRFIHSTFIFRVISLLMDGFLLQEHLLKDRPIK